MILSTQPRICQTRPNTHSESKLFSISAIVMTWDMLLSPFGDQSAQPDTSRSSQGHRFYYSMRMGTSRRAPRARRQTFAGWTDGTRDG